jgi:hypothetical protein
MKILIFRSGASTPGRAKDGRRKFSQINWQGGITLFALGFVVRTKAEFPPSASL